MGENVDLLLVNWPHSIDWRSVASFTMQISKLICKITMLSAFWEVSESSAGPARISSSIRVLVRGVRNF